MVVTHGKSILAWGLLQAGHLRLLSVFYGIHLPLRISVKDIGHNDARIARQVPVGCITFPVQVGVGPEERHLFLFVPVGALVVAVFHLVALHFVDIVAIGHAVYVDVRLPDVAAGCRVAVLQYVLAVYLDLIVHGKVRMAAEKFVALERFEQIHDAGDAGRGVMTVADGVRIAFLGAVAESKRDVVREHHQLALGNQTQVALQPGQLLIREFSGLPIGLPTVVDHVVETHIVHVAAVKRIVGGSPGLLPLLFEECLAVLVVVADDGE